MDKEYCFSCGRVGCEDDQCIPVQLEEPCSSCGGVMEIWYDVGAIAECKNCDHLEDVD